MTDIDAFLALLPQAAVLAVFAVIFTTLSRFLERRRHAAAAFIAAALSVIIRMCASVYLLLRAVPLSGILLFLLVSLAGDSIVDIITSDVSVKFNGDKTK